MPTQIMTFNDILADLKRFPQTMHLPTFHNALGSPYVVIETDPDTVASLANSNAINVFRRVLLDSVRGIVMLMSPSRRHERLTRATDRFVPRTSMRSDKPCETLGSTRWSDKGGSVEADDAYYVGDKAVGYRLALKEGESAADAFVASKDPDLVVEVTYSHYDALKIERYSRMKEPPEYWQIKAHKGQDGTLSADDVQFLDLGAKGGPADIPVSGKLSEITREALAVCVNRMNVAGMDEWDDIIDQVLIEYGVVPVDADDDTDDNDDGGTPTGFTPG